MKGKGYSKDCFVNFNQRAINDYSDRNCLAYCLNVFLNPNIIRYLNKIAAKEFNQDGYAISVLVQWMFRSALRNGEEVWIYAPSERMRTLLEQWLEGLAQGNDLTLSYSVKKKGKTK